LEATEGDEVMRFPHSNVRALESIRAALLPKLLSGEIRIKDAKFREGVIK
jgi:hypothetical protein